MHGLSGEMVNRGKIVIDLQNVQNVFKTLNFQ